MKEINSPNVGSRIMRLKKLEDLWNEPEAEYDADGYDCVTEEDFIDLMQGWFCGAYNNTGETPDMQVGWKGEVYLVSLPTIELDVYHDIDFEYSIMEITKL